MNKGKYFITTAIVGSLLCVAYAATKTKAGSLTKE